MSRLGVGGVSKAKNTELNSCKGATGEALTQQKSPKVSHVIRLISLTSGSTHKHHHRLEHQLRLDMIWVKRNGNVTRTLQQ